MSVKVKITSGEGQPWAAGVTRDQALKVEVMPPRRTDLDASLVSVEKLYREYFKNGTSNLMNVLGSAGTPIKFSIVSKTDRLISILGLRLWFDSYGMDASSSELRRFGTVTGAGVALSNGLTLTAVQGKEQTNIFVDPVGVIGDFFQYTESYFNRVDGAGPNIDILNLRIDFEVPVRIPAGSADRMEFIVRDDLRALTSFKTLAFGTQELIYTRGGM